MPVTHTLFSKFLQIDDETEIDWVKTELESRQAAAYQSGEGFFAFQCAQTGVWIHSSSESPVVDDVDAVEQFLQDYLIKFHPEKIISIEYSFCDDDRQFSTAENRFGGGASLVTARKIYAITTDVWLEQKVQQLLHLNQNAA